MVSCLVRLYLDAPTRLCKLEKTIEFYALPRVGEYLKLANRKMGDYFGFRVAEVVHREDGPPETMLERLPPADGNIAAFDESELDEYLASYVAGGWTHVATVRNPYVSSVIR